MPLIKLSKFSSIYIFLSIFIISVEFCNLLRVFASIFIKDLDLWFVCVCMCESE